MENNINMYELFDRVMSGIDDDILVVKEYIMNAGLEDDFFEKTGFDLEDFASYSRDELEIVKNALDEYLDRPFCTIEMTNGKSNEYNIISDVDVCGKHICMGICNDIDNSYLVVEYEKLFFATKQFRKYYNAEVSNSYADALKTFSKKIECEYINYTEKFVNKHEQDPVLLAVEDIAKDSIISIDTKEDLKDSIIVIRKDVLNKHYQSAEFQIMHAKSGFGCKEADKKIFCSNVYTKEDDVFRRSHVIGKLDINNLPKELSWVPDKVNESKI